MLLAPLLPFGASAPGDLQSDGWTHLATADCRPLADRITLNFRSGGSFCASMKFSAREEDSAPTVGVDRSRKFISAMLLRPLADLARLDRHTKM